MRKRERQRRREREREREREAGRHILFSAAPLSADYSLVRLVEGTVVKLRGQ